MLRIALWIVLTLLAVILLDRLGLWMERRGWIYWRKQRSGGTLASTLLNLQDIFESGKASHIIEVRQDDRTAAPDPGGDEPPAPSTGSGKSADRPGEEHRPD